MSVKPAFKCRRLANVVVETNTSHGSAKFTDVSANADTEIKLGRQRNAGLPPSTFMSGRYCLAVQLGIRNKKVWHPI
jgi:hypothetical protein